MTDELSIDEFMEMIEPELEHQLDEQILAVADTEARMMMRRHRGRILDKMRDATRIANLQHRLAEAEGRLRPRLVEG